MSGQLKEVRNRIQSVISTQQITKAMKMVSAAKLRRAQDRIIAMRPYADKLSDVLSNMVAGLEGDMPVAHAEEREVQKVLLVVITSDRGLCGGFNSSTIKLTRNLLKENYAEQHKAGKVTLLCIGKKGYDFFKRRGFTVIDEYVNLFNELGFDAVADAAGKIMQDFVEEEYDVVELIYSQFKNAATQRFITERFLPIAKTEVAESGEEQTKHVPDFIFEPSKEEIIKELVPKILKTQLFKALLDSNASENGARMTAMDKATENANELLRDLRLSYNRARQAAITTELTEIVSGANALENA